MGSCSRPCSSPVQWSNCGFEPADALILIRAVAADPRFVRREYFCAARSQASQAVHGEKDEGGKMRKSSPLISPKGILGAVAVATGALLNLHPAFAGDNGIATRSYVKTNLVSDIAGMARVTDPHLKNPWGMAASPNTPTSPGSPLWVSDNHAGVSTLYDGAGNPQPSATQPLVVSTPAPPSAGSDAVGAPDGVVFNTFDQAATDFVIAKNGASGPSSFLWATEDGTIVGWNRGVDAPHALSPVDRSTESDVAGDVGAVYKGLALVNTSAGKFLYASNFRFGTVEAFDSNFKLVNSLTDPTVPAGFAPLGIHN